MIIFDNLWETMKEKGVSQYQLIHTYHISESQLTRLRKNEIVKTEILRQHRVIWNKAKPQSGFSTKAHAYVDIFGAQAH